jgi:hypothetical protein
MCTDFFSLLGDYMAFLFKVVVVAFTGSLLAACSTTAPVMEKSIAAPAALSPSDNEKLAFTLGAIGTQNYECKANAAGVYAWAFVAPEAELFNAAKQKVGTHGAGPFWMDLDGSKTVGTVKTRADAPSNKDIPWLLLNAKSAAGAGKMSTVTSIQRINTVGGIASSIGCVAATDAGKINKQPYTADYTFFMLK